MSFAGWLAVYSFLNWITHGLGGLVLEFFTQIRNHQLYRNYLKDVPGIVFQTEPAENCMDVCWMNTIVINSTQYGHTKDELISHLKDNGIDTRLLFTGMHKQKALQDFGCDSKGDYPVCEWLTENGFYLPSGSGLSLDQIGHISALIRNFVK